MAVDNGVVLVSRPERLRQLMSSPSWSCSASRGRP